MQIVAVLAVLGATLGQPDPRDEDRPAAEQQQQEQQAGTESALPGQQQAEPPEAGAESRPADEQPAEQQQPDADSSAAGEQPAETGSDDASAGLDEASGAGAAHWPSLANRLAERYTSEFGRVWGPYDVVDVQRRQPALIVDVAVPNLFWSSRLDEDVRRWMCDRTTQAFTSYAGGILVVNLHDPAGQRQTVTITQCPRVAVGLARQVRNMPAHL